MAILAGGGMYLKLAVAILAGEFCLMRSVGEPREDLQATSMYEVTSEMSGKGLTRARIRGPSLTKRGSIS